MKTFEQREVERVVHEGWRICTNSRHPHVWNVATTAIGLFKQPKKIRGVETCQAHGGRSYQNDPNVDYVRRWGPGLREQETTKKQTKMNNRDRIHEFFEKNGNNWSTFEEILKGVDLVVVGRGKPRSTLNTCLQHMKKTGTIRWHRSKRGPVYQWIEREPHEGLKALFPDIYFVVDGRSKSNNEIVGVHEQKTLENALADWAARKGAGGNPKLYKVVELHPTLTAKLG
jgi:hypothetical protein